jgi:glycolate oxidase FAD binding subunit
VAPLLSDPAKAIWRVSVSPSAGAAVAAAAKAEFFLDWGGGLVWLATEPTGDAGATAIRAAVRAAGGGHATLMRAPLPVRAAVPVFEPPESALAALSARVKEQFDPLGILSPGRMYAGA